MFADAVTRYANRGCVRDGSRVVTYNELLTLGQARIHGLPTRRSLVLLRCALSIDAIAAYVALVIAGHVPLMIEDSLSDGLVRPMVDAYKPGAIVTPASGIDILGDGYSPPMHPDLMVLLSTSGSTGSPKLVRLSSAGLLANAHMIIDYLGLSAAERPLLHLPMSYSYGLSIIHSHLLIGAMVCLTRSSVMQPAYWEDLRAAQATSISGVPFFYQTLRRLGEARLDVPSLKTLTGAGGRFDPKLVQFFAEWAQRTGRRFMIMYGQTEAGPRIAYLPAEAALKAPDAIGVPLSGIKIELLDASGEPVPDGAPGEMHVRSPAVMMGYAMAAPDLVRGDDLHGVLATGDIAMRGEDGLLRIVGRSSRMIKVYGLRVNMDEIETSLMHLGYRASCMGTDDRLRILLEEAGGAPTGEITYSTRKLITDLFSLPAAGVEVRVATRALDRAESGKVSAAALSAAWEEASLP